MDIQRSSLSKPTTTIDDDEHIPDWLLFEVLLRLPLNSVFTCRCVSKQWLSIASAPYFITAYASRASTLSKPHWIILSPYAYRRISDPSPSDYVMPREVYLQPRFCTISLPRPEAHEWDSGLYVVLGVSNGLVLLNYNSRKQTSGFGILSFYIYNPIMGHWIKACQLVASHVIGWGFLTRVDGEFVLKSYRIVQAVQHREKPNIMIFNVYYSEIDEWKEYTAELSIGPELHLLKLQKSAAVLDGILHWADIELGVIAYDPETNLERMRLIRYPQNVERPHNKLRSSLCVVCGGELRLVGGYVGTHDNGFAGFSIWKLDEDYEWCLEHKIEIGIDSDIRLQFGLRMRLENAIFDPRDSDVVFFYIDKGHFDSDCPIFSYDLKSGTLDYNHRGMILEGGPFSWPSRIFPSWSHILILPPWPTHVVEKHLHRG